MSTATEMLTIMALDPDACLRFSPHTQCWYVTAGIEVSDGVVLRTVCEHETRPEDAVRSYYLQLQQCQLHGGTYVISRNPERRAHQWNGGAFVEVRQS